MSKDVPRLVATRLDLIQSLSDLLLGEPAP